MSVKRFWRSFSAAVKKSSISESDGILIWTVDFASGRLGGESWSSDFATPGLFSLLGVDMVTCEIPSIVGYNKLTTHSGVGREKQPEK